jgi:VWFA-related protein
MTVILRRVCPLAVLIGLACIPSLAGQTAGAQQTPRFTVATDHVTTPVIVRDSRGTFVPGLTIKDFELFEDGVRQTLSTFVSVIGGQALTETAPAPRFGEALLLPPTKRPDPGRVFVIFIDDKHIQFDDSVRTRRVLELVRDTLLHDGDLVTVVSTGPSSIQQQLGYDPGRVRFNQSISKVMGSGMSPAEIIAANQTAQGPAGLRHDAHVAFSTAYDLLAQLARIPNRKKAFLYLSSGYDFNPYVRERFKAVQDSYISPAGDPSGLSADDINRFRNPFESGGHQFSEMELIAELAALTREAQRANVTFYAIDPRGLVAGPSINSPIGVTGFQAQLATSLSSLRLLGDETGGFCLCQTNDFLRGLRKIDDATSDYYLIGYTSSNADQKQVLRKIDVRVTRPGVSASGFKREYTIRK